MSVKFTSHVDEKQNAQWFIILTDTLSNEEVICDDLEAYKTNIQQMAQKYANDIEVVWSKSKTLSPKSYQDLNEKMALLQKEYDSEIQELKQNEV